MTGVPALGLPYISTFVLRSASPAILASPLWSITANNFAPALAMASVSEATVSVTGCGLLMCSIPETGDVPNGDAVKDRFI